MDRVLPKEKPPRNFSLFNAGIPQDRYGTVDRGDAGTAYDVRIRKFQKGPAMLLTEGIQNLRAALCWRVAPTHRLLPSYEDR